MQTTMKGRVWKFGDDISTDHIIAGRYLGSMDPKVLGEHVMENIDPAFAKNARAGDIIVAGSNFGCGSSREQAPIALKAVGISCVVANSFARIFFRNAINIGFTVVECLGLAGKVEEGDVITIDLDGGLVLLPSGERQSFLPFPPNIMEILRAGGLVPKLRRELGSVST